MHDFEEDLGTRNTSRNPQFHDVVAARRQFLKGGMAVMTAGAAAPLLSACASAGMSSGRGGALNFASVPFSITDAVMVPQGYQVDLLWAWGDPIQGVQGPAFKPDASNSAAEQAQQAGMHHDGMHFFPLEGRSDRGLLVLNHEYTDDGLLHNDGMRTWSADKVAKSQAAHGVSVIEIALQNGSWQVVPSRLARRVTAATPIRLSGPAAGHALVKTAADPAGQQVLGTLNNCAHGYTPWGTYLTCEENFNGYFSAKKPGRDHGRYGVGAGSGYRWHEHDQRFDADVNPNEPNRFGYVVEIDPLNPQSTPVKRTALGRFKHEGATVTLAKDGRVVVYSGDDERNEYIYKFVSAGKFNANDRAANMNLLDSGTLYVAAFYPNGKGEWVALKHGENGLTEQNGFPDQGSICVRTRQAADRVGATMMDRPEWIAVHPQTRQVYCTLTNNSQRGSAVATDDANPRRDNLFGHIIRWNEEGGDSAALKFGWDIFAMAGNPAAPKPEHKGNVVGDAYGSPDGLEFDQFGTLWIQTDISTSILNQKEYAGMGHNMMLAANIQSKETRRFLTGPAGCEITGVTWTPDGKSMFVNIQHPGESPSERTDPGKETALSHWPHNQFKTTPAGRPRSGTIVIRKRDGGVINS